MIRVTSVLLILTANKHLETLCYISFRIFNSIVFKESSFVFITCLIYPAPSCWPTPALSPPCQPPTLPDFPLQQEATKQPWKTLKQGVSVTSKTGKCCLFKQINFSVLPWHHAVLQPELFNNIISNITRALGRSLMKINSWPHSISSPSPHELLEASHGTLKFPSSAGSTRAAMEKVLFGHQNYFLPGI